MITALRAELFKARTSRLLPGLLAIGTGMTLIVGVVSAGRAGGAGRIPSLATPAGLRDAVTDVIFGLVMAAVYGAVSVTAEFRHKTATDTYLCEPRRGRVLTAQVTAAGLAALVFGLAAAAAATVIGLAFAMGKTTALPLGAADLVGFAAGAILAAGLLAAVGAAVGALIRSQVGAVAAIFVWWIGVELIVPGLSAAAGAYLPFTAGETLAGARAGGDMPPLPTGEDALPFAAAAALIAGAALAIAAVAARTTVRRDVV